MSATSPGRRVSARLAAIAESATLAVDAKAKALQAKGERVIGFGAGEPDFPTPEHVKAAAIAAITQNFTKYTPSAGTAELRAAVCSRYKTDYGVTFAPEQVIITAGGKQALFNVAMALFEEGDEVITHAPYWPTIVDQIKVAGASPVIVRMSAEDGFRIDASQLTLFTTPSTKAIIINSPSNPTGALIDEASMVEVADTAARLGLWVIVDLCYERLIYDRAAHNLVRVLTERLPERAVLCGSTSKAYAMTGWRCGWAIGPASLIAQCNTIQGHATTNVCSITQRAAVAALTGPQNPVTAMLAEYQERRDHVHQWVTDDLKVACVRPAGAFYLLPNVTPLLERTGIRTSAAFAERLLHEAHVAVTPGEGFDAPGFIRISYATSLDRLREGVTRIARFVAAVETSRA